MEEGTRKANVPQTHESHNFQAALCIYGIGKRIGKF